MSLAPGSRIGPYEITSAIGAGGMGEVYRARDTRLQRDVAIKVLPALVLADPDRLLRFEREAQALAALNHPNIAQVFGVVDLPADVTGQAGGTHALAMELVEGDDLAVRLRRGAIPLDEALLIARQIAEGLESAHDRGIVHRDLKPANIKVRTDGTVKVLDFGLAKAMDPLGHGLASGEFEARTPDHSPTFTSPALLTQMGVVIGTAAYMSPEQAKGKAVDKRADIWAFGVVLFEMLTATPAYARDSVAETLSAVIKDDVPLERIPRETPPAVRRLLARCLERDPRLRLRDIGEARIALSGSTASDNDAFGEPPTVRERRPWRLAAAVALALGTGLFAGWMVFRTTTPGAAPVHFTFVTDEAGDGLTIAAPSPDGRHIALVGAAGVWVRPVDSTGVRQLVADVQPHQVFWSPDSRWVAFVTSDSLKKVPIEGGGVAHIADISRVPGPFNPMGGGAWLPDDRIVFTTGFTGLMQVNAGGGEPTVLVPPSTPTEDFHGIAALPSGGFLTATHDGDAVDELVVLRNGMRTVVLETKGQDLAFPEYSATGHILFQQMSDSSVWAVRFDEGSLRRTGEPFLVLQAASSPRASSDGRVLVATASRGDSPGGTAFVGEGGQPIQRIGPDRILVSRLGPPDLSPDGRRLALIVAQGGMPSAWIHPVDAGLATQVTDGAPAASVSWLPSGGGVLVVRGAQWCLSANCFAIERHSLDGSAPVKLATGWSPDVSPDGQTLIYSQRANTEWDLAVKPIDGSREPVIFDGGPGWQFGARFSPDGRYVAFMSMEAGRATVYVAPFPSGERRRVATDAYWPVWSRDGKRLYYAQGTGAKAVEVSTAGIFAVGPPAEVLPAGTLPQIQTTRWPSGFDVSADGTRFLIHHREESTGRAPGSAHVLIDWLRPVQR